MKRRIPFRKLLAMSLMLSSLYTGSYGFVRWRKVLVHTETYIGGLKGNPLVTNIRAGVDLRKTGVGAFKNAIAKPMEVVYTPLRMLECHYRNIMRS